MTQLIAACLLIIPPIMTKENVLSSPAYITSVASVDSQLIDSPSPQCVASIWLPNSFFMWRIKSVSSFIASVCLSIK